VNTDLGSVFITLYLLHNLRMGPIAKVFVPGRSFKPSLMFASKAGDYSSEASTSRVGLAHKH